MFDAGEDDEAEPATAAESEAEAAESVGEIPLLGKLVIVHSSHEILCFLKRKQIVNGCSFRAAYGIDLKPTVSDIVQLQKRQIQ